MTQKALSAVSALLLVCGIVQGARGGWIYAKAQLAQVLLVTAWEKTRQGQERVRPWPWADSWPVARLSIPEQGRDLIVLAGASGRNLAFAPGHLDGSAAPGAAGACVVAGHRDTHFAVLEDLKQGDRLFLYVADGTTHTYRIAETAIVHDTDTWVLAGGGAPTLVLVTCWPFDSPVPGGPLRYVIWAEKDYL